jgi:hypothetical protein
MRWWLLVHWIGLILWLGPGIAGMFMNIRARREPPASRALLARFLAPVYGTLIGPGAMLTAVTGVILTMRLARGGGAMGSPGLMIMQVTGLVGALIVLFVVLPAAGRLARVAAQVDADDLPPAFNALRKRVVVGSSVGGTLGVIALVASVFG